MHVTEILARKGSDVVTVGPDDTIGHAADVLAERRFGALVVSTGDGRIEGILSERDLVRGLAQFQEGLRQQPVSALMTSPVKTCVGADKTEDLMERMTEHRIRHLPVEQDGRLVGMISIGDVVKARVSELEDEARHLEGYISGAGYA
jgi:CBS domain-containing protein